MHGSTTNPYREPGLFVIWDTGRASQGRIMDDLAANFHINRVAEFHWDPAMVWANYQRFYSDTHIRGSAHARNKGSGPFLAVSLSVDSPTYERRLTRNRGWRWVNTQMFDAKNRYREWTDGWGIHCGENLVENIRDTYMLFGPDSTAEDGKLREWNGTIEILHRDPLGAHGWESFDDLFGALNRAVDYILIYYGPPDEAMNGIAAGHSFDILTADYDTAHPILHCGPRIPAPLKRGGEIETLVGGKRVKLNLRYPGDGVFDQTWATLLLDARELDSHGFYRPKQHERYWLMAHHAVAQRAKVNPKCLLELASTAANQELLAGSDLLTDDAGLRAALASQLARRGIWDGNGSALGTAIRFALSELQQKYQILSARFRTSYFAARDTLLAYLPFLTSIKRSLKTLASGN